LTDPVVLPFGHKTYVSGRAKSQSVGRTKRLTLAFVISLVPFAAQADIADVFRQFDRGTPADRDFVKTLILGIEDGFEAANDELKANGKPMLYCAPEAIKFTGDQLVEILRRWVDANRAKAPRLEAAPPATALLYALEDAFPCR
jgi:Rap1a immunity proteins